MMKNIIKQFKYELEDYKILLRNVPALVVVFFAMSCIGMNIFAQKELLNIKYLALDCGFLLSWMSFLCMDVIAKWFGARAAIKISFISIGFNLLWCLISFIISNVGLNWSTFYTYGTEVANDSVNDVFGGTWYVLLGSTVAMAIASVVNALVNAGIGKLMKRDTFGAFALRSYVSTMIGQFVDNLVFALLVSVVFFGWTPIQVIMCSLTGAVAELLAEVIFSPIGFTVCKKWEKNSVGMEYIRYRNKISSKSM